MNLKIAVISFFAFQILGGEAGASLILALIIGVLWREDKK